MNLTVCVIRFVAHLAATALLVSTASAQLSEAASEQRTVQTENSSVVAWFMHLDAMLDRVGESSVEVALVEFTVKAVAPARFEDEVVPERIRGTRVTVENVKVLGGGTEPQLTLVHSPVAIFTDNDGKRRLLRAGHDSDTDLFLSPGDRVLGLIWKVGPETMSDSSRQRFGTWWLSKALQVVNGNVTVISEVIADTTAGPGKPQLTSGFGLSAADERVAAQAVPRAEVEPQLTDACVRIDDRIPEVTE